MKKPRVYNSELLLKNLIEGSNTNQIIKYIKSLNQYIGYLELQVDLENLNLTFNNESTEERDEE